VTLFDPGPEPGSTPDGGVGVARETAPEAAPEVAEAGTARLRLELAYDGSGFRGFAAQRGQRTVAGELAQAIAKVTRRPVEVVCAGRTDAGVHAAAQVAHVDVPAGLDLVRVRKSLNTLLAPAVVVRRAEWAASGFDARRSARARRYRYLVLAARAPDPLVGRFAWHVPDSLDLRAMAAGADALVGEHDFRAFCRRPPRSAAGDPIVRVVLDACWSEQSPTPDGLGPEERLLRFDVAARSFCHQMVRSMVGVLVDVGRGRRRAADVVALLRAGDRSHAMTVAPPHGLCLVGVDYPDAVPVSEGPGPSSRER
jgi:tRNA pseudouridine38-40 synthase